jgi:aminoglycoside phosphotransferase (APT) family kinase protein
VTHPWKAERAVSVDEARALVSAQFPELSHAPVRPFGEGWDNTAFLVGDFVFRFPRRAIAVELLENEARVLPRIAPALPLPVPVPRFLGAASDAYPWPFVGYPLLPGRTAPTARLDDAQRIGCAEPVARFLAALHALPADGLGVPGDNWHRLDPAVALPKLRARLALIAEQRSYDDPSRLEAALDEAARDLPPARTDLLVHGDLYASHLLVDDQGAPAGVIDWGDVHRGDRAIDLAFAPAFLPPAGQERFRRAYGEIDDDTWRLARFRALAHAVLELGYAHDVSASDALAEVHGTLARLL